MSPGTFMARVKVYDPKTGEQFKPSDSETTDQYHSRIITAVKASTPIMTGSNSIPSTSNAVLTAFSLHYPHPILIPQHHYGGCQLSSVSGNDGVLYFASEYALMLMPPLKVIQHPYYNGVLAPARSIIYPRMHAIAHPEAVYQVHGLTLWLIWRPTQRNLIRWNEKCLPLPPEKRLIIALRGLQSLEVVLMQKGQSFNLSPGDIHAMISITESCHFRTEWFGTMASRTFQPLAQWLMDAFDGNEGSKGGNPRSGEEYSGRKQSLDPLFERLEEDGCLWAMWYKCAQARSGWDDQF
jgi:hypothetical protein